MRRKATDLRATSAVEAIPEESPKEFCEFPVAGLPAVGEAHMGNAFHLCDSACLFTLLHPFRIGTQAPILDAEGDN